MRRRLAFGMALLTLSCGTVAAAGADFFYVQTLNDARAKGAVVIDARRLAACAERSLAGARCLPPRDFLGPHDRLASFRDVVWVLGAAGLSGKETALVAGDDPTRRDFVAGILYLAGQARVAVLTPPLSPLVAAGKRPTAPGTPKGMFRNPIYQGWPRARLIVLREELARALRGKHAPYLLDGRSLRSYWGERIRGWRGGHLPGAQPFPMTALRLAVARGEVQLPGVTSAVAYADNPYDSIAYFTLLRAGAHFNARVYAGGWQDWAYHTTLPVDAGAYFERQRIRASAPQAPRADTGVISLDAGEAILLAGTALALAAAAFFLGRRRA
ncbi:MAG: hypothetical protein KGJ12_06655 [Gammaproteobacteria bacterium]|nr:hypothetical protein [Gammaproteobacteria bacterium]